MEGYLFLIPLIPFTGFLINGLLGQKIGRSGVYCIGCSSIGLAFLFSILAVYQLACSPAGDRLLVQSLWSWMAVGNLNIDVSLMIDPLSAVMVLVVTGVSFVIHIYSIGYMAHDESYWRFFSYLNMFVFFMIMLVLGSNYIVMFVGWEGVGLASYLLIGFWYKENVNADAGKKAFIVNRIGDFGFLLGMFLMFVTFGSLSYLDVFPKAVSMYEHGLLAMNSPVMIAICLLLFLGATGKSAQIPLFVWLPDAMAGPTPVSALIHAATMVTAGVYMVARTNILYTLAPTALLVLVLMSAATAFIAATIGILQNDIKRVLAYSTVSQLGYMFIGVSVAAFGAGIFHLMTHAFFKACLFLCSGSVIHAMGGDQDMRSMGGLWKKVPITYVTMLFATIAIAGVPPFAGFFSKDEILWKAFTFPYYPVVGKIVWFIGVLAAGITAFYMFRLIFMTFHGKFRGTEEQARHLHESPFSMTGPLMILAFGSLFGGWLGIPHIIGGYFGHVPNVIENFFEPVFEHSHGIIAAYAGVQHYTSTVEWVLMGGSVAIALCGISLAYHIYIRRADVLPDRLGETYSMYHKLVYNKYFVDEIYYHVVVLPFYYLSMFFWKFVDAFIIDDVGANGQAWWVQKGSGALRLVHNGYVQTYGAFMLLGLVVMVWFFIL
jgi:NADH-quinone oxidoreductase subunit L